MKKLNIFFVLFITLLSCSSDDENSLINLQGEWELTQMSGNIPNSETTGTEMEWQETYRLNTDGTFQKSRDRDGVITSAFGTYNIVDLSDGKYLEFIFNDESVIIGSCYSGLKEEMFFQSENIFSSTWSACDGPGLKYEKVD